MLRSTHARVPAGGGGEGRLDQSPKPRRASPGRSRSPARRRRGPGASAEVGDSTDLRRARRRGQGRRAHVSAPGPPGAGAARVQMPPARGLFLPARAAQAAEVPRVLRRRGRAPRGAAVPAEEVGRRVVPDAQGARAGREHGDRGLRAGQVALPARLRPRARLHARRDEGPEQEPGEIVQVGRRVDRARARGSSSAEPLFNIMHSLSSALDELARRRAALGGRGRWGPSKAAPDLGGGPSEGRDRPVLRRARISSIFFLRHRSR